MSKTFAVIIGVSNYTIPSVGQLPFCIKDIKVMKRALIAGLAVLPENIITCGETGIVTIRDFYSIIQTAALNLREQDTFLFYFSGHGGNLNGKHNLVLSDSFIPTNDVINLLDSITAKNKIIILDSCFAGNFEVSGTATANAEDFIDGFAGKGYSVLASCNASQVSRPYSDKSDNPDNWVSLFTSFLCAALSNPFTIREGKKSLNDIHKLLFLMMDVWNRNNPDQAQTPIYRASLGGTIFFQVKDYTPYHSNQFYLDNERYIIKSVQPVHNGLAKRYSVEVILKEAMPFPEIAAINQEIVSLVKPLEIYQTQIDENQWKQKPANIVFCYYALSETDILQSNYLCHTTWVDDNQDKSWWYREGKNCELIQDVLIQIHPQYFTIKQYNSEHTGERDDLIRQTKQIISELASLAEKIIAEYNEYRNEERREAELIEFVKQTAPEISRLCYEESNLDIPPDDLFKWSQACTSLACVIQDLALYYSNDSFLSRSAENRKACMEISIKQYYKELEKLRVLEENMQ